MVGHTMRRTCLLVAFLVACLLAVAGCSDDSYPPPSQDPPPPPPLPTTAPNISYAVSVVTFGSPGTNIAPLTPTNTGGAVASYAIAPPLPTGLTINAVSGIISNRPTAVQTPTVHTVTATNVVGTSMATIQVAVIDATGVVAPQQVNIAGSLFVDATSGTGSTTITVGTTVRWTNLDMVFTHWAQSTSGPRVWADVPPLAMGQDQFLTFNATGTFPYRCGIHTTFMFGDVTVTP